MTISDAQIALQRRADRLVSQEVNACMSSLVATLAAGYSTGLPRKSGSGIALDDLAQQADHLAAPVPDYESAAREAGWLHTGGEVEAWRNERDWSGYEMANPQAVCEEFDIEPRELEVYEHWAVSQWLAEKLLAKGERVDTDFAGLNVWARTTTGQAISMDSVIEAITAETGYASGGEA